MSLVERIGGMTCDEFLGRVSSVELTEWMSRDREHHSESWWQVDTICRTIVAAMGNDWPKPGTFIPGYKRPVQSMEEMKAACQMVFDAL